MTITCEDPRSIFVLIFRPSFRRERGCLSGAPKLSSVGMYIIGEMERGTLKISSSLCSPFALQCGHLSRTLCHSAPVLCSRNLAIKPSSTDAIWDPSVGSINVGYSQAYTLVDMATTNAYVPFANPNVLSIHTLRISSSFCNPTYRFVRLI